MRTCTAHVRGHCTHRGAPRPGPAMIILISISLPRFRRAEIELDLSRSGSVETPLAPRPAPYRLTVAAAASGRRGWGPSHGIDVKPAASGVPSTRPDSLSRFFHTCRAIWNARGPAPGRAAQCSSPSRTWLLWLPNNRCTHIFRIRSLHVHPPARQLASADGPPVGPRRRVADAAAAPRLFILFAVDGDARARGTVTGTGTTATDACCRLPAARGADRAPENRLCPGHGAPEN